MNVMYKYTFTLANEKRDHVVGDMFNDVLENYLQWRAADILSGVELQDIKVQSYPKSSGQTYHVDTAVIKQIVNILKPVAKPPKLYKGVNLNNFADNTVITLDGDSKDYQILRSWFPDDIKNKEKLQITKESIYSLSIKDAAEKLTQSIKKVLGNLKDLIITDATANVGGNTLNFATHFAEVNAVEIDDHAFQALENNIKVAGYKNVTTIHADYLKVMNEIVQDVIFFDPPWGGVGYWEEKQIMLKLDDKPIYQIINDLIIKPKLVVIKAPKNFALAEFKQKVESKHVWSRPYFKHQIILVSFEEVDTQEQRCKDMQKTCPNDADPILYEDWCEDVPYQEFVKNDEYLSQCYRLSTLIKGFKAGLEATKNETAMPQWPVDPISQVGLPEATLEKLYLQALDAKIKVPELFVKFMDALQAGRFNVEAAMKGQYIEGTDKISQAYREGFVEPAVEILFGDNSLSPTEQEEKDLALAIQMSEQFG